MCILNYCQNLVVLNNAMLPFNGQECSRNDVLHIYNHFITSFHVYVYLKHNFGWCASKYRGSSDFIASIVNEKVCVWSAGGIILTGKTDVLGRRSVTKLLCPSQTSNTVPWVWIGVPLISWADRTAAIGAIYINFKIWKQKNKMITHFLHSYY